MNAARKKPKSNANKIAQNRTRLKRFGALKEGSRSKIGGKRGKVKINAINSTQRDKNCNRGLK